MNKADLHFLKNKTFGEKPLQGKWTVFVFQLKDIRSWTKENTKEPNPNCNECLRPTNYELPKVT